MEHSTLVDSAAEAKDCCNRAASRAAADNSYLLKWEADGLNDDGIDAWKAYAQRVKQQQRAATVFWVSQATGKYFSDAGLVRQGAARTGEPRDPGARCGSRRIRQSSDSIARWAGAHGARAGAAQRRCGERGGTRRRAGPRLRGGGRRGAQPRAAQRRCGAEQNAALVEESSAAAESLREQAQSLSAVVGAFRLSTA